MAITELTDDLNIVAALDDEPNDTGGLTSAQLKAKFDEAGNTIKTYINDDLIPGVEAEIDNKVAGAELASGNVPVGGTTGQALIKGSDADYDAAWGTPGDSAATPNTVMRRDAAGRAQVAEPVDDADIANKSYVDAEIDNSIAIIKTFEAAENISVGDVVKIAYPYGEHQSETVLASSSATDDRTIALPTGGFVRVYWQAGQTTVYAQFYGSDFQSSGGVRGFSITADTYVYLNSLIGLSDGSVAFLHNVGQYNQTYRIGILRSNGTSSYVNWGSSGTNVTNNRLLAAIPTGGFVLVYSTNSSASQPGLYCGVYNNSGGVVKTVTMISSGVIAYSTIIPFSDGSFSLAYNAPSPSLHTELSKFDGSGTFTGSQLLPIPEFYQVSSCALTNDYAVLVYKDQYGDENSKIFIITKDGQVVKSATDMPGLVFIRLCAVQNARFALFYRHEIGAENEIMFDIYDMNGTVLLSEPTGLFTTVYPSLMTSGELFLSSKLATGQITYITRYSEAANFIEKATDDKQTGLALDTISYLAFGRVLLDGTSGITKTYIPFANIPSVKGVAISENMINITGFWKR